jgi:hypothetical protein
MNITTSLFYTVIGPVQRLLPPGSGYPGTTAEAPVLTQSNMVAPSLLERFGIALEALGNQFWDTFENAERYRRERFLAQATDIYDVERRMQALERSSSRGFI